MRNICTILAAAAIFSLIPFQGLLAWSGYNVEKGDDFEVTEYSHKGNGEGRVAYTDGKGNVHKGYLDIYSSKPGEDLYGELTDDETGETYDVVMDRKK